jgi:hypothetical protein
MCGLAKNSKTNLKLISHFLTAITSYKKGTTKQFILSLFFSILFCLEVFLVLATSASRIYLCCDEQWVEDWICGWDLIKIRLKLPNFMS